MIGSGYTPNDQFAFQSPSGFRRSALHAISGALVVELEFCGDKLHNAILYKVLSYITISLPVKGGDSHHVGASVSELDCRGDVVGFCTLGVVGGCVLVVALVGKVVLLLHGIHSLGELALSEVVVQERQRAHPRGGVRHRLTEPNGHWRLGADRDEAVAHRVLNVIVCDGSLAAVVHDG